MKRQRLKSNLIGFINNIPFRDTKAYSPDYFRIYDIPDRLYAGKSSFRLNINIENMVKNSQLFIDVIDSQGNPIYYSISDKIMDDRSKIVTIEVYNDTPNGIAKIYIAGKCNMFNGVLLNTNKEDLTTPNLLYIHECLVINNQITNDEIIFKEGPAATLSLIEFPLYQSATLRGATIDQTDSTGHVLHFDKSEDSSGNFIATELTESASNYFRYKNKFNVIFDQPIITSEMLNGVITITGIRANLLAASAKYTTWIGAGNTHIIEDTFTGVVTKLNGLTGIEISSDFDFPVKFDGQVVDQIKNFNFQLEYKESIPVVESTINNSYLSVALSNLELLSGFCDAVEIYYRPYKSVASYESLGKHSINDKNSIFNLIVGTDYITRWKFNTTPINVILTPPISSYWTPTGIQYTRSDVWDNAPKFSLSVPTVTGNIMSVETYEFKKDVIYKLIARCHSHEIPSKLNFYITGKNIEVYQSEVDQSQLLTLIGQAEMIKNNIVEIECYFKPLETITENVIIELENDSSAVTIIDFDIYPDIAFGFNPSISNIIVPITNFKTEVELEFLFKYLNSYGQTASEQLFIDGIRFDAPPPIVDKAYIGLENVDNTSDVNKPVSTAAQTALNLKYNASNPSGFETPAQLNSRDTANRDRVNHTGAQAQSTITGLVTALAGKLANTVSQTSTTSLFYTDFNHLVNAITALGEPLTFSNSVSGPTSRPTTIVITDNGTSRNLTFNANWICMNGSFPPTTNKKVIVINAYNHADGKIYCSAFQAP